MDSDDYFKARAITGAVVTPQTRYREGLVSVLGLDARTNTRERKTVGAGDIPSHHNRLISLEVAMEVFGIALSVIMLGGLISTVICMALPERKDDGDYKIVMTPKSNWIIKVKQGRKWNTLEPYVYETRAEADRKAKAMLWGWNE